MGILPSQIANAPGVGGGGVFYDEPLLRLPYEGTVLNGNDLVIADVDIPVGNNKVYYVWLTHVDVQDNSSPGPDIIFGKIFRELDGDLVADFAGNIGSSALGFNPLVDTPGPNQVRIQLNNGTGNTVYANGVLLVSAEQSSTVDVNNVL